MEVVKICRSNFDSFLPVTRNKNFLIVAAGIGSLYLAVKAYTVYKKSQQRKKWNAVGKNVVVLHQIVRGKNTPNISPFPLKLETYLRMANIPYENDFEEPMSPKGKTPWITLNGEDISDSQLIIEFLSKKFNKDFSAHLTAEERAISRALRIMLEDHFYWVGVLNRWVYSKGSNLPDIVEFPFALRVMIPFICKDLKKQAYCQGMGRHTKTEVLEMGLKDLRAMSAYLGQKSFFMGDKPTEADCAIFGSLAQVVWNTPTADPIVQLMNGECINLKEFCLRMKETFWPDWDRCLQPPRL